MARGQKGLTQTQSPAPGPSFPPPPPGPSAGDEWGSSTGAVHGRDTSLSAPCSLKAPHPISGRTLQQGLRPLLPSTGCCVPLTGHSGRADGWQDASTPLTPPCPQQPPLMGPPSPPPEPVLTSESVWTQPPARCPPRPAPGFRGGGTRGNPLSEGSQEVRPPLSVGPSRSTNAVPRLGTAYRDLRAASARVLEGVTGPWEGGWCHLRRAAYRAEEAVGRGKRGPEGHRRGTIDMLTGGPASAGRAAGGFGDGG